MILMKLNKGAQQTKKSERSKYMTNRDKINAMSNAMLADILSRVDMADNIRCKFCILRAENCILSGLSCFDGIKAWLDAPVKEPDKQPTDNKAKKLSVALDKVL